MQKVKVLIADDHAMVREGLRSLLQAQPDIEFATLANAAGGLEGRTAHAVRAIGFGSPGGLRGRAGLRAHHSIAITLTPALSRWRGRGGTSGLAAVCRAHC